MLANRLGLFTNLSAALSKTSRRAPIQTCDERSSSTGIRRSLSSSGLGVPRTTRGWKTRCCTLESFSKLNFLLWSGHWQIQSGDSESLEVEHVQALCDFCSGKILPLLERPITKDQYLAIAKKSNLTDYFEQRRSKYGWDEKLVSHIVFKVVVQLSHQRRNSPASASQPGKVPLCPAVTQSPQSSKQSMEINHGETEFDCDVRKRTMLIHDNCQILGLPWFRVALPCMSLDRSEIG